MLQKRLELSQQGPAMGSVTVLEELKSALTVNNPLLRSLRHPQATCIVESSLPTNRPVIQRTINIFDKENLLLQFCGWIPRKPQLELAHGNGKNLAILSCTLCLFSPRPLHYTERLKSDGVPIWIPLCFKWGQLLAATRVIFCQKNSRLVPW